MFFQRIFTPGLAINTYLLGDEKSKRCAVIDPTRHVVPLIIQAQNAGLEITDILETHVHADFVSGSKELKHQLNDKPRIYASGMGGAKWIPAYADTVVVKGTKIQMGDLRLEAIHTPGHTREHLMWVCYDESRSQKSPWFAFTGDCVFVGSIGRPDLLGKEEMEALTPQLYKTLFETLDPFPDFLEIFPGHGEGSLCGKGLKSRATSTLGFERLYNTYFKKEPEVDWINRLKKEWMPPAPDYFKRLKLLNVQGPPLLKELKAGLWKGDRNAPSLNHLFLLDVRHPEIFASSHFKGSLNIPLSPIFCPLAGWMVPPDLTLGLILEKTQVFDPIVDQLRLIGIDQEIFVIQLGDNEQYPPESFASFQLIDAVELGKHGPSFEPFYVVDVRSPEEWQEGHIPGSHPFELTRLKDSCGQLPKNRPIVLLCRSGQRASLAASWLLKCGFSDVINLRGGMQAWKLAGLPVISVQSN